MFGRLRLVALIAAALGVLLWTQPQLWTQLRAWFVKQDLPNPVAPAATQANKCLAGHGGVLYVTGDCPPGTKAVALTGGTVNTVAATPVPPPAASGASSPLRRLNNPEEAAALRDKRMQKVVDP